MTFLIQYSEFLGSCQGPYTEGTDTLGRTRWYNAAGYPTEPEANHQTAAFRADVWNHARALTDRFHGAVIAAHDNGGSAWRYFELPRD